MRFQQAVCALSLITVISNTVTAQDETTDATRVQFAQHHGAHDSNGERFDDFTKDDPQLPSPQLNLDDWATETFALPPGFAPELPVGSESLLFPPGWRDPDSENFWSYAFVMSIEEQAPDMQRVQELLELYYDGLMAVFASNKDKESLIKPTKVAIRQVKPNHYEATMHLVDAFATFEPMDIRVLIEAVADGDEHSFVHIRVSKQSEGHAIWKSLAAAIGRIKEENKPTADP